MGIDVLDSQIPVGRRMLNVMHRGGMTGIRSDEGMRLALVQEGRSFMLSDEAREAFWAPLMGTGISGAVCGGGATRACDLDNRSWKTRGKKDAVMSAFAERASASSAELGVYHQQCPPSLLQVVFVSGARNHALLGSWSQVLGIVGLMLVERAKK